VLIITGDPIGAKLAGPAIRAWNIAEALSADNDVTLLSLTLVEEIEASFNLVQVSPGNDAGFAPWEEWADVIVFQGHAMEVFPVLQRTDKILVADIYDPMHLEQLEQARELPRAVWEERVAQATWILNQQLSGADFFICASERQRLFFLGQLAALGRVNPANYEHDRDLTGLIAVVPFGLSQVPPVHQRDVLKGILPGIDPDDKLLLWSGGLYNWFDPKTLINAVSILSKSRPNVRLFFQGTKHPHPGVPEMEIVSQSRELARSLGVLNSSVFFNESWVDYSDRQNYLMEGDVGVSTHHDHIETTMSFRTRILDYLWAGLPMVVTDGDVFAELIAKHGLGSVVPADDAPALANALEQMLFDETLIAATRANVEQFREQYYWDRALAPLVKFVANPSHAPDRVLAAARGTETPMLPVRRGMRRNASLVLFYLKTGGPSEVVRRVLAKVRRRR
jgi:glycosyltransferase involved in cell wall biosynthesis